MTVASTPKLNKPTQNNGTKTPEPSLGVRNAFLAAALSMSWQLAVVVLVPIIGGVELDKHYHTYPVWMIIGFIVAAIGFYGVMRRLLSDLDSINKPKDLK